MKWKPYFNYQKSINIIYIVTLQMINYLYNSLTFGDNVEQKVAEVENSSYPLIERK